MGISGCSGASCRIIFGACVMTEDAERKRVSADQLVAMGFDAVPQLIAALDDRRFTRSVECCAISCSRIVFCESATVRRPF